MGMGSEQARRRRASALVGFATVLGTSCLMAAFAATPAGAIGFLGEWGGTGNAPGQFAFPVSVAVDSGGHVYVADAENDRVEKFTESGEFIGQWGSHGSGPGQFSVPESVAVDSAGRVYVVDKGNFRVQKFGPEGEFLGQWGSQGTGPGQFAIPEGIAVDTFGNVYVADAGNDRIEKFKANGELVLEWGGPGTGQGQFNAPDSIAADAAKHVFVADSENDRVQKFTDLGAFLKVLGSPGGGAGEFNFPVGVGVDPTTDDVYVADSTSDRVEAFAPTGSFLFQWGVTGSGPGQFLSPVAVAASAAGRVFVADGGNDRIEVFGKLPPPQYGKSVDLGPVSGVVKVHVPGTKGFYRLGTEQQLPLGTIVDTDAGRVRLTSSKAPNSDASQSADFFDGTFRVLQTKHGRPITVLKLENGLVCRKGKHGRASASRRQRGLWGSGKGNFRSVGRHGSATVRGTIWWAQDRCNGTLFKVKRGVVTIRDFTLHRTIKLHRGQHYLAPAG